MEPVPKPHRPAAMRHLVAGAISSPEVDSRAEAFLEFFTAAQASKRALLWWVCAGDTPQAVAMTLTSRGRVGFLYHSPADVPGVNNEALVPLLRAISDETLRRGATMVQSMVEVPHDADERVLTAAGLENLVELIAMQCELADVEEPASSAQGWRFRDYRRFRRTTLIETIRRTYEDTLDCPRLCGLRCPSDILASHRTTGLYRPQWWWLAMRGKIPAGCILVNAVKNSSAALVVYMGVTKEYRGQGLGLALLQHARRQIQSHHLHSMRLSVDAKNTFARNLYDRFGFVEMGRKRCFVLLPKTKKRECE